jgi:hypothetical protein
VSFSEHARNADIEKALLLMYQGLSDRPVFGYIIEIKAPPYNGIYPTTWRELERQGYIRLLDPAAAACMLSGPGWRAATDILWHQHETVFQPMLSRVLATLKDSVKGRNSDTFAGVEETATSADVPAAWVANTVESNLIDFRFEVRGPRWYQNSKQLIRVPLDIGLRFL